jgi:hypothetical protein
MALESASFRRRVFRLLIRHQPQEYFSLRVVLRLSKTLLEQGEVLLGE